MKVNAPMKDDQRDKRPRGSTREKFIAIAIDETTQTAIATMQDEMADELGFRPTKSQAIRRLVAFYQQHK